MIAIDAAGSRWLKYGSTRRHVQSLQVVLADGQVLEVGREPLADGASTSTIPRKRELVNRLAALLTEHAELIRQHQPQESAEPLRIQSGRRARRRPSRRGPAVGRLRGHAGLDDRGHCWAPSRCRGIAAWRCCCSTAWRRPPAPCSTSCRQPHGLRPDGPPAPEPRPRGRAALRPADSRRRPRPRCWSSRTATTRWRCAAGCIAW